MAELTLTDFIRNIPDFPKPGIQFKDITPLLNDGPAFRAAIQTFIERYQEQPIDTIVAVEARGFVLAAPLAYQLGIGFAPIRKPGKLPADTYQVEYELEYGTNMVEIHRDALRPGSRVLVMDDLLATGGTAAAACNLVEKLGSTVVEVAFLIELSFLKGRDRLQNHPIFSIIQY
jgi:adenine phosphoribosyltransferase